MDVKVRTVAEQVLDIWQTEIFRLGDSKFTFSMILTALLSIVALVVISSLIKRFLVKKVFARTKMDTGTVESIATIVRYFILIIGTVVVLQTSGINLSMLGVVFGALGIGIGFGLQNVAKHFISGIIILIERPIKVGDRIEVGDLAGRVETISARATVVVTNDNIAVIVPNSYFIDNQVVNWSYNEQRVRLNFPVGVSYKEDPERVRKLVIEAAAACEGVLEKPAPDLLFEKYGDSSLDFNLRVWTEDYAHMPLVLKSKVYYAVFEKFKEHGIEIPFPQRDLHLRSGFEQLKN
jgi:small-conductance mechanosensitive channel